MTNQLPQQTPPPQPATNQGSGESENKGGTGWMTALVALIAAAGTIGGTMVPSYLDGLKADRKFEIDARSACIQRVDNEEQKFRSLAESFSVSIGRFEVALRNSDSNEEMLPKIQELSDTGRRLGVYSSTQVNDAIINLVTEIASQILHPSKEGTEQPSIDALVAKWHSGFSDTLKDLSDRRAACSSKTRSSKS